MHNACQNAAPESLEVGYESLLIKAVDEGFSALGKPSSEIIYDLLESDYGITREDIPEQFVEFSRIFRRIIIGSGAEAILELIIRRFYSKLEAEPPAWNNIDEAIALLQEDLRTSTTASLASFTH